MEPWFSGEALPGCGVSVGFFLIIIIIILNNLTNNLTDVAFYLHLSVVNDQSFTMFDGSHMQASPSLDVM